MWQLLNKEKFKNKSQIIFLFFILQTFKLKMALTFTWPAPSSVTVDKNDLYYFFFALANKLAMLLTSKNIF